MFKKNKPTVYLTFDDGPNEELNDILTILAEKKIKATFFLIEPQIRKFKEQSIRLVKEGHYPGLHSVTHDQEKLYKEDPLNIAMEMEQTRQTLLEVTGMDSRLTRAPYGSNLMTQPFRDGLANMRMKMWDWDIDTVDWKYKDTDPQRIIDNTIEGLKADQYRQAYLQNLRFIHKIGKLLYKALGVGKNKPIVILLHVTKGTKAVLPVLIDYIQREGYSFSVYNPNNHFSVNFWNDERL